MIDYTPRDGSYIHLDEGEIGRTIHTNGATEACPGFPGCDFRMDSNLFRNDVAVNVKVTGRTLQRKFGAWVVRVRVEFVGDCEPSTFAGGWMYV